MKLNKAIRLSLVCAAGALSFVVTGCYMMPGAGNGTAKVAVAVGAKGIPANLTSVALVVTAPGMATISTTASVTAGSITVSVPAGPSRTFTLLLNGPSATLEGVATVDLQPGETTTVNVTPTLGATQIVVPDYLSGRLVQISDMTGTGWTMLSNTDTVSAHDVAFDSLGRLYVASGASIFQMNDITSTSATTAGTSSQGLPIASIAMDLTRGLMYFIDSTYLYSVQVTPTLGAQQSVLLSTIFGGTTSASGIAVDSDGFLYITNTYLTPSIAKVDASTFLSPKVVASYGGTLGTNYFWDILVKGNDVYVTDFTAKKILRFTKSLAPVDSFPGPTSSLFLGPERFVAILNKPITVIDESGTFPFQVRLASFNDITGAGWTTYGSYGTSTTVPGQFQFYIS